MSFASDISSVRIGAVSYLNSKPLIFCLRRLVPEAVICEDLPSRLADRLEQGDLDVALVPSIEYFRNPDYVIVSDACIACEGAVRSVNLYSRVPVERIRTLALDEGSRTSAALTQLLLRDRFGVEPVIEPLPIGVTAADCSADAMLVIGDRGMFPPDGEYHFVWDMGCQWLQWTGLPFVFAMWIGREDSRLQGVAEVLTAARDEGVTRLAEIARQEAPAIGIPEMECLTYFSDHLQFRLREPQRQGLALFGQLASRHGLAPEEVDLVFYDQRATR